VTEAALLGLDALVVDEGAGAASSSAATPPSLVVRGRFKALRPGHGVHAGVNRLRRSPVEEAQANLTTCSIGPQEHRVRKDVREFIRRLETVGLTVEATPGHYNVLRDGKPLRKTNGMPFTLPFSPDTTRWRKTAIIDLRKLGIDV
jgi:hypothetical protein